MKRLHRPDLYGWTVFDEDRNLDFHSVLLVRRAGNVVVDPLPMSNHDQRHLRKLGGVGLVVVTNADHTRIAEALAIEHDVEIAAPIGDEDLMDIPVDRWLTDGDTVVEGLEVLALQGSKTPGEIALLLDGSTLITGDLVRAHMGGQLDLLPAPKLTDAGAALLSLKRLAALNGIEAVLTGDGWPVFRDGTLRLRELVTRLEHPG